MPTAVASRQHLDPAAAVVSIGRPIEEWHMQQTKDDLRMCDSWVYACPLSLHLQVLFARRWRFGGSAERLPGSQIQPTGSSTHARSDQASLSFARSVPFSLQVRVGAWIRSTKVSARVDGLCGRSTTRPNLAIANYCESDSIVRGRRRRG
jgi:hypothetical protein